MNWRAARPWTCGAFAAALFLGGCAGPPNLQTQSAGEVSQSPAERNRARILELQARQSAQPGFDAGPELLVAFENARAVNDREGAAYAAALLINSGDGTLDLQGRLQEVLQDLGQAVVDGLEFGDASMQPRMRAALTTVCARGLRFGDACQSTRAFAEIDPQIISVWIGQGYRHLQMEDFEKAEAVLDDLRGMLTERFVEAHGLRAADILFLDAALLGFLEKEDSSAHVERGLEAIQLVEKSFVDAGAFSAHLHQLSEQFRARGMDWLARLVAERSVELAAELGAGTVQLAKILHETGRWQELLELKVKDEDWVAERTLELYQSDAAHRVGEVRRAQKLRAGALALDVEPSLEVLEVLQLAARLDVNRGDLGQATRVLELAAGVEARLSDEVLQTEVMRGVSAGLLGLRALVHARSGNDAQAARLFGEALANFAELSVDASSQIRVEVLEAWGATAQNIEQFEAAFDQLRLFRTQLSALDSSVTLFGARDASAALIRLALIGGDAELARTYLQELFEAGLSPESSGAATICLRGMVGFYGAADSVAEDRVVDELRRCAEVTATEQVGAQARWLAGLTDRSVSVKARVALTKNYEKTLRGVQARERERLKFFVELGSKRQESAGDDVRSGIAFLLADLRPVQAQTELARVLRDNPELDEAMRMELEFLRLQVFVLLGQWHEASQLAADCAAFAAERKDRRRLTSVRAMVKRFSLSEELKN